MIKTNLNVSNKLVLEVRSLFDDCKIEHFKDYDLFSNDSMFLCNLF